MPDSPTGATYRASYNQLWRQTGRKPPQLCIPEPQPEAMYLFDIFQELNQGQAELSYTEIHAFCKLKQIKLTPSEVGTLIKMFWAVREAYTNG